MSGRTSVTDRLEQIGKAIEALKNQVSSTDWQQANTLRMLGELVQVVRDLAGGDYGETGIATERRAKDRKGELDKLLWMAVKALPPGTGPEQRDAFIQHVLTSWNVSASEMATLGYGKA